MYPLNHRRLNLAIVFAITLMAVLGVSSMAPALPTMAQDLQVSSEASTLLVTVFTLPGVILAPLLGILADRWGRRKVLIPSLLLFGLAGGACSLARDFELLLGLRFFQGIGAAALGALSITLIGDFYSEEARSRVFGYNAAVLTIGTATYPLLGGALALLSWRYVFLLPLAALPLAAVVISLRNPEPRSSEDFKGYVTEAVRRMSSRNISFFLLATMVTFIILYGPYLTTFPFLLEYSFGSTPFTVGIIMSSMSVTTALTSSRLAKLSERFSGRNLVQGAFLLYALALVLMPLMPNIWVLFLPTMLFGFAQGINIPSIQKLLSDSAPAKYRGAFMSTNAMMLRLGQTLGPLIMALILMNWGLVAVFFAGACISLLMLLLLLATD
ncbi:MAG: MFS transporter [Acidobacteriota bacterium]